MSRLPGRQMRCCNLYEMLCAEYKSLTVLPLPGQYTVRLLLAVMSKCGSMSFHFGRCFLTFFHALSFLGRFGRSLDVVASVCLFLTGDGEVADALHVADDAGEVIHVLGVTAGTLMQITLVDIAAVVADGVGDVEGEVIAAFLCRNTQELAVLWF